MEKKAKAVEEAAADAVTAATEARRVLALVTRQSTGEKAQRVAKGKVKAQRDAEKKEEAAARR